MTQICSILPTQNVHLFQARQSSFKCKSSPFRPLASRPTLDVKKHLKNLENLLPKPEPNQSILTKGAEENKGKHFLQGGLNLARVWPEMKAAEEMSPRNLNMLKRLLSKSNMQYSPRNILGSRWREYHGSNNWSGLLDPLDENLRREVVRYGEFIQAAYHCFHSNPATNEAPMERHVALPDRTYKVTKSLYATSSIGLPKWVDDVAPNLGWMTQRSSMIGYVAVCDDATEIERMGRRDIVIALRGTSTCLEWTENFMDFLVPIPGESDSKHGEAKVECGFQSLFKTKGENNIPSLEESVVKEVERLMEQYKGETLSITITGHSLGAALSLLVADKISTCSPNVPPVAVYSFGGPRVGNRSFASRLDSNNVKVMRVVNNQDVITKVPGMFVSEELDKKLRGSPAVEKLLNCLDKMPWAYSHVGTELRLDTTRSPFLKPNADVSCCHDLEAYLHLVDGFLASNCPFRANAKRSLSRLLNEQKSNVKMLYMSKEKDLTLNLEKNNMSTMSGLLSPSS